MISDGYRALNARLHWSDPYYGTSGRHYVDAVAALANILATRSILDYGCGKRTLEQGLGFPIANYDPCLPGLDARPAPADLVVCTDVLEHIEPAHLDAVLDDLARLTRRAVFIAVHTGAAIKTLADGRNTHLIQQKVDWWQPKLEQRFRLCRLFGQQDGFVFIGQSLADPVPISDEVNTIGPPPEVKTIRTRSAYDDEQRCANIRSSMLRGLPSVKVVPAHKRTMVLACYGPSLGDTLPELRRELAEGEGDLWTVSGAHDFVIDGGLVPLGHVESDPRPHKAKLLGKPDRRVCYFLSSACDRAMFDRVRGFECWLHHVTSSNGETNLIARFEPNTFTIDGGTNVGMSAIGLGSVLGYRDFSIYAMDCSFKVSDRLLWWPKEQDMPPDLIKRELSFHAGPHPNEDQPVYRVWVDGRPFVSSPQMFQGAQDFAIMATSSRHLRFRLHGDGFLRALMGQVKQRKRAA